MLSPGKRSVCLLLATILMAASLPLQSICETPTDPEATCCASESAGDQQVPRTDSPAEHANCGSNCTDCGLLCCVSTAVILTATPTLAVVAPIQAPLLLENLVRPQADPAPLGRPPRV